MKTKTKRKLTRLSTLSFEQAEEVFKIKKKNKHKKIDDIAVELGYLDSASADEPVEV